MPTSPATALSQVEAALHRCLETADSGQHQLAALLFLACALTAGHQFPEQHSIALELAARSLEAIGERKRARAVRRLQFSGD